MNQPTVPPDPSDAPAFCRYVNSIPYDKRWEVLRPMIEPLFYTENTKDIAKLMLDRYRFKASETQYKYRFSRVWKLHKNIPEPVKAAALRKGLDRAKEGKQSIAKYRGRSIPTARMQDSKALPMRISSSSLRQLFSVPLDQLEVFGRYTPFGNNLGMSLFEAHSCNTPSDLEMLTPSDGAQSPWDMRVYEKDRQNLTRVVREQRMDLFIKGRFADLLNTMSNSERMDISKFLYDFWYFSFASAQAWSPYSRSSATGSIGPIASTAENHDLTTQLSSNQRLGDHDDQNSSTEVLPFRICGWSIHLADPLTILGLTRNHHEAVLTRDSYLEKVVALPQELRTALDAGSFTDVPLPRLAVPLPNIASRISHSEHDLLAETIGFAIMSRNLSLLRESIRFIHNECDFDDDLLATVSTEIGIDTTALLHLATSYLDGRSTCCLIVLELANFVVDFPSSATRRLVNNAGHTLIDNVLLVILRSHANVSLSTINPKLGKQARFSGQEVDICGRWTATSVHWRSLLASGQSQIPVHWKHKFCRTSAQAICHSLGILLRCLPFLCDQESGLFSQRCVNVTCGQSLTLGPLHTIVMTGFFLVRFGRPEDLFGIVACFLCLVDAGVDPLLVKELSVVQILGLMSDGDCDHEQQTAAQFARDVFNELHRWNSSQVSITGFAALVVIMEEVEQSRLAYDHGTDEDVADLDSGLFPFECGEDYMGAPPCTFYRRDEQHAFGRSSKLGHVWTIIQAELTSPRGRTEESQSLSSSIHTRRFLSILTDDVKPNFSEFNLGIPTGYCRCGRFDHAIPGLPNADNIFVDVSLDLGDDAEAWARTSIIEAIDLGWEIFEMRD